MTDNLTRKLSAADVQAMFDRSPFIGKRSSATLLLLA